MDKVGDGLGTTRGELSWCSVQPVSPQSSRSLTVEKAPVEAGSASSFNDTAAPARDDPADLACPETEPSNHIDSGTGLPRRNDDNHAEAEVESPSHLSLTS